MNNREFIEQLGGSKYIAEQLGVSQPHVCNWWRDGRCIPWKYRPKVEAIALIKNVPLPHDFRS